MPNTTHDAHRADRADLGRPTGEVRVVWSVDARRYAESPAYRDRVLDFLLAALPGRSPSPVDAAVIEDETGQRAVTALVGITADGDLVTDEHGHRTHERAVAPLPEEADLP